MTTVFDMTQEAGRRQRPTVRRIFAALAERARERRDYRRTRAALQALPDWMLQDIGVRPGEIRWFAAEGARSNQERRGLR